MSKKNKHNGFFILVKSLWHNRHNIEKYYPRLIRMAWHTERYTYKERYDFAMEIIDVLLKTLNIEIETFGMENIPQEEGIFLCSNHQEKFDPLVIWKTFPQQIGVIVNDKACHRPFIGEFVKIIKSHKLIERSMRTAIRTISALTKELQSKVNYMIFPEGRYEDDFDELLPFKSGCFKSPLRAKVPVLPVAITDSYKIFEKNHKGSYKINIHYLKPIFPEEFSGMKTIELAELVRSRIQSAVREYQQ